MKKITIACVLAVMCSFQVNTSFGQENAHKTIRLKKIVDVNGNITETDTLIDVPPGGSIPEDLSKEIEIEMGPHSQEITHHPCHKIVVNCLSTSDTILSEDGKTKVFMQDSMKVICMGKGNENDNLMMDSIIKACKLRCHGNGEQATIINCKKGEKGQCHKKVIILNDKEKSVSGVAAKKQENKIKTENTLSLGDLRFYPNPNDGKFNLSFNLENKGNTSITVFDIQGKEIYREELSNFSGAYNKALDISKNGKGIYILQIKQGKNTSSTQVVVE